ncbi:MAG: hypothetical protein KF802_15920 [Bdellovibrionaceae bacterium]|nr:hypothetical protein [Pseudobdellovibrionaceae bacterium]
MTVSVEFFPPPPNKMLFSIVSGASLHTHSSGRKILATSGITEGPISLKDSNGVSRVSTSHLPTLMTEFP